MSKFFVRASEWPVSSYPFVSGWIAVCAKFIVGCSVVGLIFGAENLKKSFSILINEQYLFLFRFLLLSYSVTSGKK